MNICCSRGRVWGCWEEASVGVGVGEPCSQELWPPGIPVGLLVASLVRGLGISVSGDVIHIRGALSGQTPPRVPDRWLPLLRGCSSSRLSLEDIPNPPSDSSRTSWIPRVNSSTINHLMSCKHQPCGEEKTRKLKGALFLPVDPK